MLRSAAFRDALFFHAVFFAVAMPIALSLKGSALGLTVFYTGALALSLLWIG